MLDAKNGTNSPAYTPQSEIYPALLAMLDEANNLLSSDGGEIDGTADILYGGDYMNWKKFANSLKFRLLMRMSAKADVSADLTALLNRPMFSSNDDEAKLVYLSSSPNANPVYASVIAGNRAEYKVSDVLVDQLVSTTDPRLEMYVQPNADGEYRGKPAGISNVPNTDYNYDNVSAIGEPFLAPEAPGYLMSYAELQFFMAEAAQRNLIGGNASNYYNAGITASMESVGVTDYSGFLAANVLSQGTELTQIGTQKWLALFGQGVEAWTEWRRTGFPALSPALEPINITEIPSRYTYPSDEQSLNKANYSAAVAAQGEDKLTTKVWWNK